MLLSIIIIIIKIKRREPSVNSQGRPCLDYHIFKTKKIGAISYIVIEEKILFYHFICLAAL